MLYPLGQCTVLWQSTEAGGVTCDNVVVMNVTRFCYNAEEGTELSPAQG